VFLRSEKLGFCVLYIYVDNAIITGEEELMEDTTQRLGKVFNIKVQKSIEDFLGCEIHKGIEEIFLTQKRIVQKLLNSNAEGEKKDYKTPSALGFFMIRHFESEKVDDLTQKEHWVPSSSGEALKTRFGQFCLQISQRHGWCSPWTCQGIEKRLIQFVRNTKKVGLKMIFSYEKPWKLRLLLIVTMQVIRSREKV
jgi:hypothetical protein